MHYKIVHYFAYLFKTALLLMFPFAIMPMVIVIVTFVPTIVEITQAIAQAEKIVIVNRAS